MPAQSKDSVRRLHSGRTCEPSSINNYFQTVTMNEKASLSSQYLASSSRDLRSSGQSYGAAFHSAQSHRDFKSKLSELWHNTSKSRNPSVIETGQVEKPNKGNNKSSIQDVSGTSERSEGRNGVVRIERSARLEFTKQAVDTFQSFLSLHVRTPAKANVSLNEACQTIVAQQRNRLPGAKVEAADKGVLSRLPKGMSASDHPLTLYPASFQNKSRTPKPTDKTALSKRTYSICSSREPSIVLSHAADELGRSRSPQGYIRISESLAGDRTEGRPLSQAKKLKEFLNLEADSKAFRKIRDANARPEVTSGRSGSISGQGIRIVPHLKTPDKSYLLAQDIKPNGRFWPSGKGGEAESKKVMTAAQLAGVREGIYNHNHTESWHKHPSAGNKAAAKSLQLVLLR